MPRAKSRTTRSSTRKATAPARAASDTRAAAPDRRAESAERTRPFTAPASHEAIAREAYLIWQSEGCPVGQELTHWLQAEQRLSDAG